MVAHISTDVKCEQEGILIFVSFVAYYNTNSLLILLYWTQDSSFSVAIYNNLRKYTSTRQVLSGLLLQGFENRRAMRLKGPSVIGFRSSN